MALVFVLSVAVSALITIAALLISSKINPPQSGNFNLFEGYEFLIGITAGSIYGGIIGILIGLVTGICFKFNIIYLNSDFYRYPL